MRAHDDMRILRWGLHGLFAVLLLIAVVNAGSLALAAGGLGLGTVYAAGLLAVRRSASLAWLGAVTAGWLALCLFSTVFVWLAFPLFFLCLHLLPIRLAVPAVTVLTATVAVTLAVHQGSFQPGQLVGPAMGALVATLTAVGYQALYRESERRRALIDELTRTRAELAATQHEAGVLAERERLAREIHDTLAQGLSSIVLLLRAAGSSGYIASSGYVAEALHAAEDNLAEARRFVYALAPPALDASLEEALRRLCLRERVDFRLDGEPYALPRGAEIALLRIAQSGLANIARHARATRAGLTLTYMEDEVALDIVDDGLGFDPALASGSGLGFIRDRAKELGGQVSLESAPGQGTALAITLPVAA